MESFASHQQLDFNDVLKDKNSSDGRLYEEMSVPTPYELNNLKCLYWDTDNLAKHISSNRNDLFLHLNIQGLSPKFDNFITFFSSLTDKNFSNFPLALAFSETWLTDLNKNKFDIKGYHPGASNIRKDNSGRGGVSLYIREDHEFTERPDLEIFIPFIFESVFVTIKHLNITVGVIYRSPSSDIVPFFDAYLKTVLSFRRF